MDDFKIIHKELENRFKEIRRRIHRLQSGGTIDSLKNIGADTSRQIGASYVSLKQLAENYSPDESLAILLWNTQKREEQIMACLLLPWDINKEKITQLITQCISFEIAGYLGSLCLCKRKDLIQFAIPWLDSGIPYQQTAMLTALARHLILYKEDPYITKTFFTSVVNRNFPDKYVQLMAERYRFNT